MATKTKTAPLEPAPSETNHVDVAVLPMAEDAATILALDDRQVELVPVPEWGLRVAIQSLTGDERDKIDSWVLAHRDEAGEIKQTGFRAFMVAMTAVKSDGSLLFTEEQVAALGRKNHTALIALANVALRLSKMNDADVEQAAEDLGKAQSDDSGTA